MAMATLILGVLRWWAAPGWRKVNITFLNFIALPITFGIGAEYALNVVTRYREERDIGRAVISTGRGGGAVFVDHDRRLRLAAGRAQPGPAGVRAMAILGEVACLSAAIVALPALLMWRQSRPFAREEPRNAERRRAGAAPAIDRDREEPPSTAYMI